MRKKIMISMVFIFLFNNYIYASNNQKIDYLITKCMQFIMLNQLDQLKYLVDKTNKEVYKKNIKFLENISKKGEIEDFSVKKLSKSGNDFNVLVEIKSVSSSNKKINKDYIFKINAGYKIEDIQEFNKNIMVKKTNKMLAQVQENREKPPVILSNNKNNRPKLILNNGVISIYPDINIFIDLDKKRIDSSKRGVFCVGYSRDSSDMAMLIRFKLPPRLVKKAILHLNLASYDGDFRSELGIYKVIDNCTVSGPRASTSEVLSQKMVIKYSRECYAKFTPRTSSGEIHIDITDLVLSWMAGDKNLGMVIKPVTYNGYRSFYFFNTMYCPDKNLRPRLVLYPYGKGKSKGVLNFSPSIFKVALVCDLKACRQISHMQDKLKIKVTYLGGGEKSIYLLMYDKGLGIGVYKIPMFFSKKGERYLSINAPLNGFRPGNYEFIIYDINNRKLASYEFKIR